MARFILEPKTEHSDSNLFRFLENSILVHSKIKFELMAPGNKFDLLSSNLNWCNKFEWNSFETPSSNFHIEGFGQ